MGEGNPELPEGNGEDRAAARPVNGGELATAALAAAGDGLWEWRRADGRVHCSEICYQLLGYPAGELPWTAEAWLEAVHPAEQAEVRAQLRSQLQTGAESLRLEARLRARSGQWVWLLARGRVPERDSEGPLRILGTLTDLSRQKAAEEALRHSEERFRQVVEAAPDAIFVVTGERFSYANLATSRLLGVDRPADLLGESLLSYYHPEHLDAVRAALQALLEQRRPLAPQAVELLRQDGERVRAEVHAVPFDLDGRPASLWFARDVTAHAQAMAALAASEEDLVRERRRAEEEQEQLRRQLAHAQRMEAVGRLAGGVAHDFNNLLTVLLACAEQLLAELPADAADWREAVGMMEEAGQRAARLTRQLLAFGRRQILHVEIIELNAEIEALTKMIERLIGEDVSLTLRLGEQPLRIKADAGQLEQVLLNLAINARDAMPRGGHLVIETERIELSEGHAARREVAAGPYALIAVSDTGVGMSRDTLDRIFEPFYTTKEPGRGTGLGLSTVYGVVKQHGGHVSVYSEVGHGSVFRIYLPLTEEPAAPPKPAADIRLPSGDETILVVEDDQAIRQLVCAALRRHGYCVVEATSPREAVSLAEAPGGIDLLLTDVVMPDLSGPELADRVRELLPDTRVLFMTGYAEEILAHHGVDYGEFLLRKPFTARALALRVREVLDR